MQTVSREMMRWTSDTSFLIPQDTELLTRNTHNLTSSSQFILFLNTRGGPGSSVGIATMGWTVRDRIPVGTRFSARSDRVWGPPSLL